MYTSHAQTLHNHLKYFTRMPTFQKLNTIYYSTEMKYLRQCRYELTVNSTTVSRALSLKLLTFCLFCNAKDLPLKEASLPLSFDI